MREPHILLRGVYGGKQFGEKLKEKSFPGKSELAPVGRSSIRILASKKKGRGLEGKAI